MSDAASSGIFVIEGAPAGAPIPVSRETITAFVGPTPRGPADIPVAVRSVAEYQRRFGCPDAPSRMEGYLQQFFANGGTMAVIVRVCRSQQRARIHLPGSDGTVTLEAVCPGAFEFLRASVDYDNIEPEQNNHFNLVVQRLASTTRPLVVEQEIYQKVSADPDAADYVGDALLESSLVRLLGTCTGRPARTLGAGVSADADYVYADDLLGPGNAPTDYDLVGSASEGTGLFALEQVPCIDLLCLLPLAAGQTVGPVALFAAERYCQRRQALLLVDPPPSWQTVHDVATDRQQLGFDSPNVVTYFPRSRDGNLLGAIAGALVADDREHGLWKSQAASLRLLTPSQLEPRLTEGDIAVLARFGVNAVARDVRGSARLHGLVTRGRRSGLSAEWSNLRLRRTALFILGGIARGSRWSLFRANDEYARAELRQQLVKFLDALYRDGALRRECGFQSWYLRGPVQDANGLSLELGLALRRPGEFQSFRICHYHGDCEIRELGWQPVLAQAV